MATDLLKKLREAIESLNIDGFLIPRADRHLGESVPVSDERLAYMTGFTGSAGLAIVTASDATLFVDGRYALQGVEQVGPRGYDCVATHQTPVTTWLLENLKAGQTIGYDPWLHTRQEIDGYQKAAAKVDARLSPVRCNPIDAIWRARPAHPQSPVFVHPLKFAGESSEHKRRRLAAKLAQDGLDAAVITAPDSLCWLLNIRGSDVAFTPLTLAFGLLRADGSVTLFSDPAKFTDDVHAHLGSDVDVRAWNAFETALAALRGKKVLVSKTSAPFAVSRILSENGAEIDGQPDPCVHAKAIKNSTEIEGARAAHQCDGAAMVTFLAWLDREALQGEISEQKVAEKLLQIRRETAERLGQIFVSESFPAIVGFRDNGAIVHYRVSAESNKNIKPDGVLLVDSGGQFSSGTTDITRTIMIGEPTDRQRTIATLVLKGMIAISDLIFPEKATGQRLDAIARTALWRHGLDYDHGTGHGVGSFLSVHEGPQGLSSRYNVALEPGMILSNEPGYYAAGEFGVRIENLLLVKEAPNSAAWLGDRKMLCFETLTLAPIDKRLIDRHAMSHNEVRWLDAYHRRVFDETAPHVAQSVRQWLENACQPLAAPRQSR
jgi:Xaa-Pro aminopeptidase